MCTAGPARFRRRYLGRSAIWAAASISCFCPAEALAEGLWPAGYCRVSVVVGEAGVAAHR